MKLLINTKTQPSEFLHYLIQINQWKTIVPNLDKFGNIFDLNLENFLDYSIGISKSGDIYALRISENNKENDVFTKNVFALLIDPPKKNLAVIQDILLTVRKKYLINKNIDDFEINNFLDSIIFPSYLSGNEILEGLPEDWVNFPIDFDLSIRLSENVLFNKNMYEQYRVNSFEAIIENIFSERIDGYLLSYSLVAKEVTPLLIWDVDWPLLRAGKNFPIKRDMLEGSLPSQYVNNNNLLTIYQSIKKNPRGNPYFYGEPTVRLRVGGISEKIAIKNWYKCSKAIKAILVKLDL
jgi:hypothetical protein